MHSVILVSVFEIIVNFTSESNAPFSYILTVLANPSLLSILGARLLFNMKEAGEKGLNHGRSCSSKSTMSDIDFATPHPAIVSESQGEVEEPGIIELEDIC